MLRVQQARVQPGQTEVLRARTRMWSIVRACAIDAHVLVLA
jgi:hypothetical protein